MKCMARKKYKNDWKEMYLFKRSESYFVHTHIIMSLWVSDKFQIIIVKDENTFPRNKYAHYICFDNMHETNEA